VESDDGKRLAGKVAVVTGAAGGFGRAICRRLAREGADVALWDLDAKGLERAAAELEQAHTHVAVVDVSDSTAVDDAAATTRSALGPIDILVNNAGISGASEPWEVTDESWRRYMSINADGSFYCIRACLPDMRKSGNGKIVNIGSLAAQQGRPVTNPAYAASKGAVLGMTVSLARHLGPLGICVNAINPGFIKTEIHDRFKAEELDLLQRDIPVVRAERELRHGVPEDIAAAVAYLASKDADFVSGAFLNVNGATRTG
jgi:NAD(P)-dependent dehydrogenase (short-subunit alcohol dehydrogenase family)